SALGKDRAMLVFPEGTRSPGSLKEGTPGLAYLALRSGAPVLPIAITGTEQIRGMFRIAFHFKRLKVTIGQPVLLPSVDGRLDKALLASVTDQVMERIAGLLPVEYRGAYAVPRSGATARKSQRSDSGETDI
ncbi:MAG: lysophospholipid acyltransferase family protein, partial [Dehalococcoidia bacterium]